MEVGRIMEFIVKGIPWTVCHENTADDSCFSSLFPVYIVD